MATRTRKAASSRQNSSASFDFHKWMGRLQRLSDELDAMAPDVPKSMKPTWSGARIGVSNAFANLQNLLTGNREVFDLRDWMED